MDLDFKHILLVDDNEINNYYHEDLVKEIGTMERISIYTNPDEALAFLIDLMKNKLPLPGYLLVDVKMPEMDGFQFLDELDDAFDEELYSSIPRVAILTTSTHKRDTEQFDKTPLAAVYLVKPLKQQELIDFLKD